MVSQRVQDARLKLAAAGLVGQVLQEERVHRALETDMEMRDFALGQGDDLHIGIGHALVEANDVLLIARQAIHRLGQDIPERPRVASEIRAWMPGRSSEAPGDGVVGILLDNLPALLLGVETADAELIGDRSVALVVGGIAGLDRDFHVALS